MTTSGIDKISLERSKQINNGRTPDSDILTNPNRELVQAALYLLDPENNQRPPHWNDWLDEATERTYKERVRIAGALMAAELDRLEYTELHKPTNPKDDGQQ